VSTHSILITGATSGIGRALALAYAGRGMRLHLVGRDEMRMRDVAERCRSAGAVVLEGRADVRDRAGIADLIRAWDEEALFDLAIAGAGIASGVGEGRDVENPDAVRAVLAVNLYGVLNTLDPLVPAMVARGRGHLAVIGSLAGIRALPSSPAYSAAKAAVHAYAESLRPRLRRHGVVVSIVAPGFVETPLNRDIRAPRPMQMGPDEAAALIRRGLDRRKPVIAFPLPLYAGMKLLTLLPAVLGDSILDRPGIEVPETPERERHP
jgi:NADP-dependent 3-hydroxy acid dehydrogenase YdfG